MAEVTIKVEGVKELVRDLKKAGDSELQNELKAAHKEGAETVASAARSLVPSKSGALLGTIRASSTLRSGRVRAGKSKVPYAGPIHFGWFRRHIAPQPFLYDALDKRRNQVLETFKEHVDNITESVKGKQSL